jgi:hypothetical protein
MKWPSVLMFLWYVYHTCAEGLPEKLVSLSEVRGVNHLVAKSAGEAPWFDSEELSDLSLHITNYATDPESALKGPGFLSGTKRYLQHDAPIHLFFEYVAWCRQSDSLSASYSTFLRVFKKVFGTHLQFRKAGGSQHAECTLCNGYKQELRCCRSFSGKMRIIDKYTTHLLSQWIDRQMWWAMSVASNRFFLASQQIGGDLAYASLSLSVGALMADGMDQAKFRIPRMRFLKRLPKAFEALHRPAAHVFGVWFQGTLLKLWVSDEDLPKDSCTNIEGIARAIQTAYDRHGSLPLGFHVQQDNCSRECKNTYVANFMMILVLLGVFKWTVLAYLRKGHTHDMLDQACPTSTS